MATEREEIRELDSGWRGLRLATEEAEVTILPDKGADIYSLVDRRTGVDLLWKTPWGLRPSTPTPALGSSLEHFLYYYGGGWQLLLPNGGDESQVAGAPVGFHGEATLIPWQIQEVSGSSARLEVELVQVPLGVHRHLILEGRRFTVEESVRNLGWDPIEFMWSHHPAFGAPLIAPGTVIETGANTFIADSDAPGSLLPPGHTGSWPILEIDGDQVDLSVVSDVPQHHFGYLTDFDQPFYRISNPSLGLAVSVEWDMSNHPHAWFWQELNSSPNFPWHRRAYVTAIEPASTIPGHGLERALAEDQHVMRLEPDQTSTFVISAQIEDS